MWLLPNLYGTVLWEEELGMLVLLGLVGGFQIFFSIIELSPIGRSLLRPLISYPCFASLPEKC